MTWETVKLGEIIVANYGKALKAEHRDESGNHDVFGSNGYVGRHTENLISEPTIIIGRKGSVGAVTFAPYGGWTIDTAYYVTMKQEANLRFLFYALQNAGLEKLAITTSIPGLNRDSLYRVEIPLPPLEEQKRIAAILDRADALRQMRRESLARLDELAQSLFLEMFGDPAMNAKSWEMVHLRDVCSVKAGPFGSSLKKETYSESGFRVYGQEQVIGGDFKIGDYFIDEIKFTSMKNYEVKSGDILISLVGTIGKAVIVPHDVAPGIINPRLLKISPNFDVLMPIFLTNLLAQRSTQITLEKVSHGGTMNVLNAGILKELIIPLPPLWLQQQFAEQIEELEAIKTRARASLTELEALFASLQARAFAGELSGTE